MESSAIALRLERLSISTISTIDDSATLSFAPCPILTYNYSSNNYSEKISHKEDFEVKHSSTSTDDLESKLEGGFSEYGETVAASDGDEWSFDDQGLRGILVVFGCSLFAAFGIGYSFLWGTWLQELSTNVHPNVPLSTLNMISGVSNGVMTFTGFFSGRMADVYGYRPIIAIGSVCMSMSLIASAFAFQSLPAIFIIQRLCIGISQGISMPVYLSLPLQWYKKHRGLASGVAASGSGFGGGLCAITVRKLLPILGYRYTMLTYAGISTTTMAIAFLLIETRLPPLKEGETRSPPRAWLPTACFQDVAFFSFIGAMMIAVFGYMSPFYYITAYVSKIDTSLSPSSMETIFPLVAMNFSGSCGRIVAGFVADKIGPVNTLFGSFVLAGSYQVFLWPHVESYGSAMAFSILYGSTGGLVISLLPYCSANLFGTKGLATIVGFGFLSHFPGQLLGATVSGLVLTSPGGSYARVAYYSGGAGLLAAFILLPARFNREKKIFAKF